LKDMIIDLAALVSGDGMAVAEGQVNLVGREDGVRAREAMSQLLADEAEEAVCRLDCGRIGVIDYTAADEMLGKLLPRMLADEFGAKYLCLLNLSPPHMENIAVALEKRGLAVAAKPRRGGWTFLGKLNPYLRETFSLVYNCRHISARELSDRLSLALNAGSTRLINLHKQRLVGRRENLYAHGPREYIYISFNGGFGLA
jgi:hypothetical protein